MGLRGSKDQVSTQERFALIFLIFFVWMVTIIALAPEVNPQASLQTFRVRFKCFSIVYSFLDFLFLILLTNNDLLLRNFQFIDLWKRHNFGQRSVDWELIHPSSLWIWRGVFWQVGRDKRVSYCVGEKWVNKNPIRSKGEGMGTRFKWMVQDT